MESTITVKRAGTVVSTVVVGSGLAERLDGYLPRGRVVVIADANVHRLYRPLIDRHDHITIGGGEIRKTLAETGRIYRELIAMNAGRDCFILGFGGGVVTDMAGFAASTYMRGLRFGFVCSTLLAQVDAGIGGKNGVNVEGYKNMAGTFSQPEFVLCDTDLLKTLPDREFRAGLAEVVKAAVIADPELFALLGAHSYEEIKNDAGLLNEIITRAVGVKVSIVERDEFESGERRKLNLGHTFGHALEHADNRYLHGEAVSVGIAMAADIAVRAGTLDKDDARRITALLASLGLPLRSGVHRETLLEAIRMDKKSEGNTLWFVLPSGIGSCEVRAMGFDEIGAML